MPVGRLQARVRMRTRNTGTHARRYWADRRVDLVDVFFGALHPSYSIVRPIMSRERFIQYLRNEFRCRRLWFFHWDWKAFTHSPVRKPLSSLSLYILAV